VGQIVPIKNKGDTMKQDKNPTWWDADNEFAWSHVKLEMKRDWEQVKHGKKPNASRNMGHAVKQASGMEAIPPLGRPTFEELEPAFRFGYGAWLKFGGDYPAWDGDFEIRLAEDWRTMDPTRKETWEQDRMAILYGWNFEAKDMQEAVNG
jgi:hypothetical protein